MELNEETIKQRLYEKRVSARRMCIDIRLSEPTLYRFYESGNMRESNKRKIREYLELTKENTLNTNTNERTEQNAEYWKGLYEESQRQLKHVLHAFNLVSLGKHSSVLLNPAYILRT